jgi:ABC-type multidrug transport system fused ATPase/permease subunit
MASVYLSVVPLVAMVCAFGGLSLGSLGNTEAAARGVAIVSATESLSAFKTVISFGASHRESSKFSAHLRVMDQTSVKMRGRKALLEASNKGGTYLSVLAVFGCGGWAVATGSLALGSLLSVTSFLWVLVFGMQGLIYSMSDLARMREALRRIYSVMDKASAAASIVNSGATRTLPKVEGAIELFNISFSYPSRPSSKVLESLNIRIAPGQTTALCGVSGAGKTTIFSLVARFYTPVSGTVTLDGVDISTLDRDWYASQVALVSQEPILFDGTIRESIAYGSTNEEVTDEEIVFAAKQANAHSFIQALPQQYATRVGPQGTSLSGGQRQRVAIARAIARKSKILLLDEPTAALDTASERLVQEALERLSKSRTTLVVAHRLSTIVSADIIVMLGPGGRVLEKGTYAELMQTGGAFSTMVNTQATRYITE